MPVLNALSTMKIHLFPWLSNHIEGFSWTKRPSQYFIINRTKHESNSRMCFTFSYKVLTYFTQTKFSFHINNTLWDKTNDAIKTILQSKVTVKMNCYETPQDFSIPSDSDDNSSPSILFSMKKIFLKVFDFTSFNKLSIRSSPLYTLFSNFWVLIAWA